MIGCSIILFFWSAGLAWKDRKNRLRGPQTPAETHHIVDEKLDDRD